MTMMTQLDGSCLLIKCNSLVSSWQSSPSVSAMLTLTSDSYVLTVGTSLSSHNHPLLAAQSPDPVTPGTGPSPRPARSDRSRCPRSPGISRVRD